MAYKEIVPTKINSWAFSIKDLQRYKVDDSGFETENYNFKINTENLSNLTIFLFTEPSETTPVSLVNEFWIGTNYATNKRVQYGRDENKIVWNLPINECKSDDGYLYCEYYATNGYSQYWTAFVEFPNPNITSVKVLTNKI